MKKFCFSAVDGEEIRIEIEGDVKDVLVVIGELIGRLYSTYSGHSPLAAAVFKHGIQQLAINPAAPTWKVTDLPDGGIEIFTPKFNK